MESLFSTLALKDRTGGPEREQRCGLLPPRCKVQCSAGPASHTARDVSFRRGNYVLPYILSGTPPPSDGMSLPPSVRLRA